jgi:hypothetical protein
MNWIKKTSKYIFKTVGSSTIDRISKWGFMTALTFWGPGPIAAWIGYEGVIATAALTQTGVIKHLGNTVMKFI